jgi:beta-lactamase class A
LEFRKQTSSRIWFVLIALGVVLFLIGQFLSFQFALNQMPSGWTISGADVTDLPYPEAIKQVQNTLTQQPVRLKYRDQTIILQPADIGVIVNPTATLETIVALRNASSDATSFLTYIVRRAPPPKDIPAAITWSDEKLRAYLASIADQNDLHPQSPSPILEGLRMAPGRPGYELDISASVPAVEAALKSATRRNATLVVKDLPPAKPKLSTLDSLIQTIPRPPKSIVGIYVKDLAAGEEYGYNGDVAFSGMGILKIAIMVEVYHQHVNVPESQAELVRQMMASEQGNGAANALLQKLGDGDSYLGVDRLIASMKYLGLADTFMATPYDQDTIPLAIVTKANSRLDISTAPDPRMQTTPRDIALLLEMMYDCSQEGGALLVAYPNSFTPAECQAMLNAMEADKPLDQSSQPAYILGGVPEGTRVAHKHSWGGNARADAGIVFSKGGDYVLAVFLYAPDSGDWLQVNPTIKDISRATYNFFNP